MAIDTQQRHSLGSLGYDHMPYTSGPPHFNNPWSSTTAGHSSSAGMFPPNNFGYSSLSKVEPSSRPTTMSMPYSSMPASAPPIGSGNYPSLPYSSDLLNTSQDLMNTSRATYDQSYSTAPSQPTTSYAPQSATYAPINSYGQSLAQQQTQQQDDIRRLSQS